VLFSCLTISGYTTQIIPLGTGDNKAYILPPSLVILFDVELEAASKACNTNSACQSFNSDITLKGSSSVTGPSASQGGCLYIRQGMIKIQPDDNATCLTSSSQASCAQCAQVLSLSDRASCYRCLSSGSLLASQCLAALKEGRLLNYSSHLVETIYPSSLISSLCSSFTSANGVDLFGSDNLLEQRLLSLKLSNGSALKTALRLVVDDAMPASKFYVPYVAMSCSVMTGYFRPNATGNWSFLGYGSSGLDLWVGPGATYGDHVLNSLLAIDYRMEWVSSPALSLSAGVMYPLLIRSCQCGGPYRKSVFFSGPDFSSWISNGTGFYYHTPSESESLPPAPPSSSSRRHLFLLLLHLLVMEALHLLTTFQ
jgi:hypothetical protein